MERRERLLDSAGFWATLGGGVAAVGGILVGVGAVEATNAKIALESDGWVRGGAGVVFAAGLMLLRAYVLFEAHRLATGNHDDSRRGNRNATARAILAGGVPQFDADREWRLSQVRENDLQTELREWGNDRPARKYLKQVLDQLPVLPVGFAKDFAGLLYAAYQEPFTEHLIVLSASGMVEVPDINRQVTFPMETARNVHNAMEALVKAARNDRTREAGLVKPN